MDQRELDELKAAGNNHPEIETLLREHRTLDDKVGELSERPFLSPDQHLELSRLKKEKLRIKDRIEEIAQHKASA